MARRPLKFSLSIAPIVYRGILAQEGKQLVNDGYTPDEVRKAAGPHTCPAMQLDRGFLNDGSPCMEPECRVYRARVDAADVEIEENN